MMFFGHLHIGDGSDDSDMFAICGRQRFDEYCKLLDEVRGKSARNRNSQTSVTTSRILCYKKRS